MTKQVAVKLPDELVVEVDRLVDRGDLRQSLPGDTRRVEAMVATGRRAEIDRLYQGATTRLPETRGELDDATRLAVDSIHEEPWERWW